MAKERFTNKKVFLKELNSVYDFHGKVFNTIVDLLKKKGDIELKTPITFSFLDMEGYYKVRAVRLFEGKDDFYLEATSESGDEYKIDWCQINYDMVIIEWLMGFKWNEVFPEYDY